MVSMFSISAGQRETYIWFLSIYVYVLNGPSYPFQDTSKKNKSAPWNIDQLLFLCTLIHPVCAFALVLRLLLPNIVWHSKQVTIIPLAPSVPVKKGRPAYTDRWGFLGNRQSVSWSRTTLPPQLPPSSHCSNSQDFPFFALWPLAKTEKKFWQTTTDRLALLDVWLMSLDRLRQPNNSETTCLMEFQSRQKEPTPQVPAHDHPYSLKVFSHVVLFKWTKLDQKWTKKRNNWKKDWVGFAFTLSVNLKEDSVLFLDHFSYWWGASPSVHTTFTALDYG